MLLILKIFSKNATKRLVKVSPVKEKFSLSPFFEILDGSKFVSFRNYAVETFVSKQIEIELKKFSAAIQLVLEIT